LVSPDMEFSEELDIGVSELAQAAADRNEVRARRILFDLVSEETSEGDVDVDSVRGRETVAFAVDNEISA
jgi:hypothetical protein